MLLNRDPEHLYHYTTIKTLPFMFKENGKVELRLTDYRFLNDAEEGIYLGKYIEKHRTTFYEKLQSSEMKNLFNIYADFMSRRVNKLEELNCEIYVISFSELDDSMQFWRQDYAKDKGICLKLKTSNFKVPNKLENTELDCNKNPLFSQVQYLGINDNFESVFPNLEESLQDSINTVHNHDLSINDFGIFYIPESKILSNFDVKNKVWRSEKEWRFKIVRLGENSTRDCLYANYEIDDSGIPRAKIEIENPFEEIILGPSFNTHYVSSIKTWLCKRGFNNINVRLGDGVLND